METHLMGKAKWNAIHDVCWCVWSLHKCLHMCVPDECECILCYIDLTLSVTYLTLPSHMYTWENRIR